MYLDIYITVCFMRLMLGWVYFVRKEEEFDGKDFLDRQGKNILAWILEIPFWPIHCILGAIKALFCWSIFLEK
jgi:hypothetical protein